MITFASAAVALILGAVAGGVIVTAVLVTAIGTQFARGLNW